MSRQPRIQFPGAIYHVTSRGDRRQAIVADDVDREHFFDRIRVTVEKFYWEMFASVLMTNHFHLFFRTPQPNLSRGMQFLLGGYANWWNARQNRTGHVFQGRFRGHLVEDETYFWTVTIDVDTDVSELHDFQDGKKVDVITQRALELFLQTTNDVKADADGQIVATYVDSSGNKIKLESIDADVYLRYVNISCASGHLDVRAGGWEGNIVQPAVLFSGQQSSVLAGESIDLWAKKDISVAGTIWAVSDGLEMDADAQVGIDTTASLKAGRNIEIETKTGMIEMQEL